MGVLISCCLRLIGYDHLDGETSASTARRKHNINSMLADRDNPNVDGRRAAHQQQTESPMGMTNEAMSTTDCSSPRCTSSSAGPFTSGWSSSSDLPAAAAAASAGMPKGFKDDGTKDSRTKLRLNLVDSLKRSTPSNR